MISERASKCKYCQREIVWEDNRPYDARLINEVYVSGKLHFLTCPAKIKEREQKACPVCLLRKEPILDININRNLCKIHKNVDYKELRRMKMGAKQQIKKNKDFIMLKQQHDDLDTFL